MKKKIWGYPKFDEKEFLSCLEEYLIDRDDDVDRVTFKVIKAKLPTIEGFAYFYGVTRKTLYDWEKAGNKTVEYALETIKQEQLRRLIDEGLVGNYNPTIVKLLLSHNHGIKEETSTEVKGEIKTDFTDEQIKRIASRISKRGGENGDTSGEEESN